MYDNHISLNSLDLLQYSLDKPYHGINCRAKSIIFVEMCLALNIPTRMVWMMPCDLNDTECHVVIEIYDLNDKKWYMLDMTNDLYLIDNEKKPLSLLEAREKWSSGEPCTAVMPAEKDEAFDHIVEKNKEMNTYYLKNMFYFVVYDKQGFGDQAANEYYIVPEGVDVKECEITNLKAKKNYYLEEENGEKQYNKKMKVIKDETFHIASPSILQERPYY